MNDLQEAHLNAQLDRLHGRMEAVETRLAVVEASQHKIDALVGDVRDIRTAVLGDRNNPDNAEGLVKRFYAWEVTEVAEHGTLRALVVAVPVGVGLAGVALKLLGV